MQIAQGTGGHRATSVGWSLEKPHDGISFDIVKILWNLPTSLKEAETLALRGTLSLSDGFSWFTSFCNNDGPPFYDGPIES